MLNLDTHVVLLLAVGGLNPRERRAVAEQRLAISDIVLWELAMLARRGRVVIDFGSTEVRSFLRAFTVIPITLEIARMSTQLDFSSDPADEIIAATSVVERIPLMTRDRRILKSRIVPFAR